MWPTALKKLQLKRNLLFIMIDWSYSMNSHRPRMYQRVIKEIRKTYLNQKLSNKKHQFPSTTTINALGIIRTIPSLQQPLVLAALLAQPRLLRPHQQLHQFVPPNLYYQVPLLLTLELQHPIATALPAHRKQPLLSVRAHLHLNLKHLQKHQLTPEACLAALPRRLVWDPNHGSAQSLTTLLVLFNLVMY